VVEDTIAVITVHESAIAPLSENVINPHIFTYCKKT